MVVVSGPRRTGKSTLVRTAQPSASWNYRSLDDSATRDAAHIAPDAFVAAAQPAVIDEVQREPNLLIAIKALVDRELHPERGQFVLTGSADILNHPKVTESLAGRAAYMRMGPLTQGELRGEARTGVWTELFDSAPTSWAAMLTGRAVSPMDWRDAVRRGGLPEVALADTDAERADRLLAYVDTYMERDLRDLAHVDSLPDFRRVLRALALRTGGLLNSAEVSRDVQVSATTLKRWMDLLDISYLLVRLEAYTSNRTSRLIKSAKVYWADSALGLFLGGAPDPEGVHLENLILADLLVWRDLQAPRPSVMHWRSVSGREVDFVIERGKRVIAVEMKASTNPSAGDAKHLHAFLDEYKDVAAGALLLHGGADVVALTDRLVMAPWWRVL